MHTREATFNDKEAISTLLSECYNATPKESATAFDHEIAAGIHYLVAEEDNKLAGFATWVMHGIPKHGLAELDRIAVTTAYRGKGVAQNLMQGLIAHTQRFFSKHGTKLRKLYLLTHADNERAQAFYKKMGFVHEATLKNHFYTDKDEWVMSIFLD